MPTGAAPSAHSSGNSGSSDSPSEQHNHHNHQGAAGAAAGAGPQRLVYFRVTDVRPATHAQPDAGSAGGAGGPGAGSTGVDHPQVNLPLLVSPEHTALTLQVGKGRGQGSGVWRGIRARTAGCGRRNEAGEAPVQQERPRPTRSRVL